MIDEEKLEAKTSDTDAEAFKKLDELLDKIYAEVKEKGILADFFSEFSEEEAKQMILADLVRDCESNE